jgi:hypothetical protein
MFSTKYVGSAFSKGMSDEKKLELFHAKNKARVARGESPLKMGQKLLQAYNKVNNSDLSNVGFIDEIDETDPYNMKSMKRVHKASKKQQMKELMDLSSHNKLMKYMEEYEPTKNKLENLIKNKGMHMMAKSHYKNQKKMQEMDKYKKYRQINPEGYGFKMRKGRKSSGGAWYDSLVPIVNDELIPFITDKAKGYAKDFVNKKVKDRAETARKKKIASEYLLERIKSGQHAKDIQEMGRTGKVPKGMTYEGDYSEGGAWWSLLAPLVPMIANEVKGAIGKAQENSRQKKIRADYLLKRMQSGQHIKDIEEMGRTGKAPSDMFYQGNYDEGGNIIGYEPYYKRHFL